MKKSFTPNMSQEEITEYDKRRGKEDKNQYINPGDPVKKEPWKIKTPVNNLEDNTMSATKSGTKILKSLKEGEDFGKPLPAKEEGESKPDYMSKLIAHNSHKDWPGGKKQAIAVAASEAGMAKKSANKPSTFLATEVLGKMSKMTGVAKKAKCSIHLDESCPEKCPNALMKADDDKIDKLVAFEKEEHGHIPTVEEEKTEKALNSKSLHIPRPKEPYDPYNIYRSAVDPITRGNSKIYGPEGTAPLVGETLSSIRDDDTKRTHGETFKSCEVHGISYNTNKGCYPCNIVKSLMCKNCGGSMNKTAAGVLACSMGC